MIAQDDRAFLAGQDRVPADHALGPDPDPCVALALGVEDGAVVDDGVVADFDLVRMAEDDVPTEDHSLADTAQDKRKKHLAQKQAQGSGTRSDEEVDQFVSQEGAQARRPTKRRRICPKASDGVEKLLLGAAGRPVFVHLTPLLLGRNVDIIDRHGAAGRHQDPDSDGLLPVQKKFHFRRPPAALVDRADAARQSGSSGASAPTVDDRDSSGRRLPAIPPRSCTGPRPGSARRQNRRRPWP